MDKNAAKIKPKHIAIIMDGNGRWASQFNKPRIFGHRKGVESVRAVIRCCRDYGIRHLTLFAFSTENWQRPEKEVTLLMELFINTLEGEIKQIHDNNVCLKVIGDHRKFTNKLRQKIDQAQAITKNNDALFLTIAANYGGRWDILQASKALAIKIANNEVDESAIDETFFASHLSTGRLPDPDLFIRTGGEYRISNYLLWQLAYTEFYFTSVYWPDFTNKEFDKAIDFYSTRQRRFGLTGQQIEYN